MGLKHLTIFILKEITLRPLENTKRTTCKPCSMSAALYTLTSCHLDALILHERVEQPHGITPSANTGNQEVRELPLKLHYLLPRLFPYYRLEVSDHNRVRMRSEDRTHNIVRIPYIRSPVPQGLTYGVLEGPCPYIYPVHLCAQELHPEYIKRLPLDILLTHIYLTLKAEHGSPGGCCDTVLPCPCLGYYPLLPKLSGKEHLADNVVYLVCACMAEVLALKINLGTSKPLCQPLCMIKRSCSSDKLSQVVIQFLSELLIFLKPLIHLCKLDESRHQGLRDVPPAVDSKMSLFIRHVPLHGSLRYILSIDFSSQKSSIIPIRIQIKTFESSGIILVSLSILIIPALAWSHFISPIDCQLSSHK